MNRTIRELAASFATVEGVEALGAGGFNEHRLGRRGIRL